MVMIRNWPSAEIARHLIALGKWKYFLFFSFSSHSITQPLPQPYPHFFTHYLPLVLVPHSFPFFIPPLLLPFFISSFSYGSCSILALFYRSLLGRLFSFPSLAYPS